MISQKTRCVVYLAGLAGLSPIPTAVCSTATHKGRVSTQHDVEDDAEAPQVTALIVDASFFIKGFHHLRGHVFS